MIFNTFKIYFCKTLSITSTCSLCKCINIPHDLSAQNLLNLYTLTNLFPMYPFSTPRKNQKILRFSDVLETKGKFIRWNVIYVQVLWNVFFFCICKRISKLLNKTNDELLYRYEPATELKLEILGLFLKWIPHKTKPANLLILESYNVITLY